MKATSTIIGLIGVGLIYFAMGVVVGKQMDKPGMTNDAIIAAAKLCRDANLIPQTIHDRTNRYVLDVQCITKIKEAMPARSGRIEA